MSHQEAYQDKIRAILQAKGVAPKPTENSISIASSAMLVELSISSWTARKLDKKVSTQVDLDKQTKTRAGNYNKNLLAGTGFLDTITKYAANARAWHISQTLPWSDNGLRLLPMSNFMTYKQNLTTLETNYQALVDKFIIAYPNLVSAAAFQLGDLFNRDEYPEAEKIVSKFKFTVNYLPVPMAGDFRIDIGEEAKAELVKNCERAYNDRLNNAMKDAWGRLHECLMRMSERLADNEKGEKKIFRDSLVENAVELVDLLKHFNLTGDTNMELARNELAVAIMNHDADDLRESFVARESVKKKVDDILSKFSF
jgi:hypothetical protein